MRNNLKRIREAAKSISAWGSRYGTYAPLEQALGDLATEVDNKASQIFDLRMAIERLTAEVSRLTMMLDEYVRLDNAGKIPLEPVGGAVSGSPTPPTQECRVLIEKDSPAVYLLSESYGSVEWTNDASRARNFAQKEYAEKFIASSVLKIECDLRIEEHIFIDGRDDSKQESDNG